MTTPRRLSILGATGSVGQSTLDIFRAHRDRYRLSALTAHRNGAALAKLALELRPEMVALADGNGDGYRDLKTALSGSGIAVAAGRSGLLEAAACPADWTMAAIVGAAGLEATLAATRQGGCVALANKECLVCAGPLLLREAASAGTTLLPVDSEHNAIFQVFDGARKQTVRRLILTASGGPFRRLDTAAMGRITVADALRHPVWQMGAKISIDSATMMNKALELIEAHVLFGVAAADIDILVHPQSVIHSMVEYIDGSVLAQMAAPDMRVPILHALAWPGRMAGPVKRLDLAAIARLDFEPPDENRFPALGLARRALAEGPAARIALNAANEVAVAAFLEGRLDFPGIARLVETTLDKAAATAGPESLEDILRQDRACRLLATGLLRKGWTGTG